MTDTFAHQVALDETKRRFAVTDVVRGPDGNLGADGVGAGASVTRGRVRSRSTGVDAEGRSWSFDSEDIRGRVVETAVAAGRRQVMGRGEKIGLVAALLSLGLVLVVGVLLVLLPVVPAL